MTNEKVVLNLEKRERVGRHAAKVRQEGLTPGVVYGKGVGPIVVQAPEPEVLKVVRQVGRRQPVELEVDGKKRTAIIKNISRNPTNRVIENVEFHAIKQNEKVTTSIPIALDGIGESEAERLGLVVLQALEEVEVKALPKNLPEELKVSIKELSEAGEHVTVANTVVPEGVEIEAEVDTVVASVYEPAALQAANDAAGGDTEDVEDVAAENGAEEGAETAEEEEKKG